MISYICSSRGLERNNILKERNFPLKDLSDFIEITISQLTVGIKGFFD